MKIKNIDIDTIKEAINRSDVKNIKKFDNKIGHKNFAKNFEDNAKFIRDGEIEQWKKHFSNRQIQIYENFVNKYKFLYD